MKTLITEADIKEFAKKQEKEIHVEANSIITPAAKDKASELGIEIVIGRSPQATQASESINVSLIAKIVGEVMSHIEKKPITSNCKGIGY